MSEDGEELDSNQETNQSQEQDEKPLKDPWVDLKKSLDPLKIEKSD